MLCTFGFVDDVMLCISYNGPVACCVFLSSDRVIEYGKHSGRDYNQILLNKRPASTNCELHTGGQRRISAVVLLISYAFLVLGQQTF